MGNNEEELVKKGKYFFNIIDKIHNSSKQEEWLIVTNNKETNMNLFKKSNFITEISNKFNPWKLVMNFPDFIPIQVVNNLINSNKCKIRNIYLL